VYIETKRRLEQFQRRVREGVSVEEAQDFARYVQWSGILQLMAENPPPNPIYAKMFDYDACELRSIADALNVACCEYWQGRTKDSDGTASGANKSDLEAIDRKLNVLGVVLADLVAAKKRAGRVPQLRLVKYRKAIK